MCDLLVNPDNKDLPSFLNLFNKCWFRIPYAHCSASICLFNVSNRNTRLMGEICPKLTKKNTKMTSMTPFWCFIVNFERISHIVPVFPSLTLNKSIQLDNYTWSKPTIKTLKYRLWPLWKLKYFQRQTATSCSQIIWSITKKRDIIRMCKHLS